MFGNSQVCLLKNTCVLDQGFTFTDSLILNNCFEGTTPECIYVCKVSVYILYKEGNSHSITNTGSWLSSPLALNIPAGSPQGRQSQGKTMNRWNQRHRTRLMNTDQRFLTFIPIKIKIIDKNQLIN